VVVDAKVDGKPLGHFHLFCKLSMGCKNNNFSSRVMNYIETKQAFLGFFCIIALGVTIYLWTFARKGIIFYFYEYLRPFCDIQVIRNIDTRF
jgi:hypothetical protein